MSAWVYNWAFATAHAFLRELKAVDGVGVAVEDAAPPRSPMAVASQSPLARVRLSLQVAGLAGQFGEHIYVTSMVARPKPAPDIYLLAAQRLGAAPADCIVIEDSPAGAAAALGAGMRVIGYAPGNTRKRDARQRRPVIHSMDELIPVIAGPEPDQRVSGRTPRRNIPTAGFCVASANFRLLRDFAPSDGAMAPGARLAPLSRSNQSGNRHESESGCSRRRVARGDVVCMRRRR